MLNSRLRTYGVLLADTPKCLVKTRRSHVVNCWLTPKTTD